MKLLKLLIVPAVVVLSVVMAVPAFAHDVTKVSVTSKCTATGQICIHFSGTIPADGNDKRTIKFDLFGVKGSTLSDSLGEVTFDLPASTGTEQTINLDQCFNAVTATFDHFLVKYEGTVSGDLELFKTVKDAAGKEQQVRIDVGDTVVDNIAPCVAQATPTPQTPTPTASAAAATTLAGTGGLDFRYPLVGLTAVVAGLALLLVSASRGRSSTK